MKLNLETFTQNTLRLRSSEWTNPQLNMDVRERLRKQIGCVWEVNQYQNLYVFEFVPGTDIKLVCEFMYDMAFTYRSPIRAKFNGIEINMLNHES